MFNMFYRIAELMFGVLLFDLRVAFINQPLSVEAIQMPTAYHMINGTREKWLLDIHNWPKRFAKWKFPKAQSHSTWHISINGMYLCMNMYIFAPRHAVAPASNTMPSHWRNSLSNNIKIFLVNRFGLWCAIRSQHRLIFNGNPRVVQRCAMKRVGCYYRLTTVEYSTPFTCHYSNIFFRIFKI